MSEGKCGVCSKSAVYKCSGCKQVSYCSKEHQKEDWKTHRNVCRPFEVRTSAELGRYLVATRDIDPGSVILSENPIIVGPKIHVNDAMCLSCLSPARLDSWFRCPRCQWPTCGPSCPGDLKGTHAAECSILCLKPRRSMEEASSKDEDLYHYDAITPLRCLLQQRKNSRKWQQLLQMESHMDLRGPGTETFMEIKDRVSDFLHKNFLEELKKKNVLDDVSEKTLHQLCGILDVNALEIVLPQGSEISALYPTAYLMEHNCLPNTRHTFETAPGDHQFRITVEASQRIPKGEHISTMYTHVLWGTQYRREHLRTTKYFECMCKRCSDPTELGTYLSALICMGTETNSSEAGQSVGFECGGILLPVSSLNDSEWRCNKCPVSMSSAQVREFVAKIGDDIDALLESNATIKQLEDMISKLSRFLHPNHFHLYSLQHSLIQLYGNQQGETYAKLSDEVLEKKIKICKNLLAVTETLDPGLSRAVLYSSVLLIELFTCLLTQARRKYDKGIINKDQLQEYAQTAHQILYRAIKSLKSEPQRSPGRKLAKVAKQHLSELNVWATNMSIQL